MRSTSKTSMRYSAFTLTELIIAVVIMGIFLTLAVPNMVALLQRYTMSGRLQRFVSAMQMAADAAAQTNNRYEMIIDIREQTYTLRQISSDNLSEVLEEEIIDEGYFGRKCWVSYVMFDDGDYTNEGIAKFRVGHAGWQYGGKIVFLDEDEQAYSVVVNRLNGVVELKEGDVELLWPKAQENVPF